MITHLKKYIVEAFGTFLLAFVVFLSLHTNAAGLTPLFAAIVLGFAVYTIGTISGSHINPAITLGFLSIKKISPRDALFYIVAQFIGAVIALGLGAYFMGSPLSFVQIAGVFSLKVFIAETLGTLIFAFGIASVVYEKSHVALNGSIIGLSLLLGVLVASFGTALGFLNPAVALTNGSFNAIYAIAPIIGAVLGMNFFKFLAR